MTRHAPPAVSPYRGKTGPSLETRPPHAYERYGFVFSQSPPPLRPASPQEDGSGSVDGTVNVTGCGAYSGFRPPPHQDIRQIHRPRNTSNQLFSQAVKPVAEGRDTPCNRVTV